jgi:transketolase
LQEGQIWEAAMFAPHYKLDNLIVTVDWNGQQIDGANDDVISLGDLRAKWEAFGWEVHEFEGNDMTATVTALEYAKSRAGNGKPIVNLMKTEMGAGVDFMMGSHKWHGVAPNEEQTVQALSQLEETLGDF